ncbi:MAG: DUF1540 domain-containing protein [Cellulosilyticaceae bacterium]
MTQVSCSVANCSYNTNNQCFAGEILISGQGIHESQETCCGSYLNKEAYANLAEYTTHKEPVSYVKCKVGDCRHYQDNCCSRHAIQVAGQEPTHLYIETSCHSFEAR